MAKGVLAIVVNDEEIFYIPKGITKMFKPKVLQITNSKLKKVNTIDLEEFNTLNYLDLSGNEIEILESELFIHNTHLMTIMLNNNRITVIHGNPFKGLKKLQTLDLRDNYCFSDSATVKESVSELILRAVVFCSPQIEHLKVQIAEIQSKLNKMDGKIEDENQNFEKRIKSLKDHEDKSKEEVSVSESEENDLAFNGRFVTEKDPKSLKNKMQYVQKSMKLLDAEEHLNEMMKTLSTHINKPECSVSKPQQNIILVVFLGILNIFVVIIALIVVNYKININKEKLLKEIVKKTVSENEDSNVFNGVYVASKDTDFYVEFSSVREN